MIQHLVINDTKFPHWDSDKTMGIGRINREKKCQWRNSSNIITGPKANSDHQRWSYQSTNRLFRLFCSTELVRLVFGLWLNRGATLLNINNARLCYNHISCGQTSLLAAVRASNAANWTGEHINCEARCIAQLPNILMLGGIATKHRTMITLTKTTKRHIIYFFFRWVFLNSVVVFLGSDEIFSTQNV